MAKSLWPTWQYCLFNTILFISLVALITSVKIHEEHEDNLGNSLTDEHISEAIEEFLKKLRELEQNPKRKKAKEHPIYGEEVRLLQTYYHKFQTFLELIKGLTKNVKPHRQHYANLGIFDEMFQHLCVESIMKMERKKTELKLGQIHISTNDVVFPMVLKNKMFLKEYKLENAKAGENEEIYKKIMELRKKINAFLEGLTKEDEIFHQIIVFHSLAGIENVKYTYHTFHLPSLARDFIKSLSAKTLESIDEKLTERKEQLDGLKTDYMTFLNTIHQLGRLTKNQLLPALIRQYHSEAGAFNEYLKMMENQDDMIFHYFEEIYVNSEGQHYKSLINYELLVMASGELKNLLFEIFHDILGARGPKIKSIGTTWILGQKIMKPTFTQSKKGLENVLGHLEKELQLPEEWVHSELAIIQHHGNTIGERVQAEIRYYSAMVLLAFEIVHQHYPKLFEFINKNTVEMAEQEELSKSLSKLPAPIGELLYREYYSEHGAHKPKAPRNGRKKWRHGNNERNNDGKGKEGQDVHENHGENQSESEGSDLYKTDMDSDREEGENHRGAGETMGESSNSSTRGRGVEESEGSGGGHQAKHDDETNELPNLSGRIGWKKDAIHKGEPSAPNGGITITDGTTDKLKHLKTLRVDVNRDGEKEWPSEGQTEEEGATQTNSPTFESQSASATKSTSTRLGDMFSGIAGSAKSFAGGAKNLVFGSSSGSQPQSPTKTAPHSSPDELVSEGEEKVIKIRKEHSVKEGDLSRGLPTDSSNISPNAAAGQAGSALSSPSRLYGLVSSGFSKVLGRGADGGGSGSLSSPKSLTPNASPVHSPRNSLTENAEHKGEEDVNVKKNSELEQEGNASNGLPISSNLQGQSPPRPSSSPKSPRGRLGAVSDFFTNRLGGMLSTGNDGGGGSPSSSSNSSTPNGSPTHFHKDLSAGGLEPRGDDNVDAKKSLSEQEKVPSSKPSTPTKKSPRLTPTSSLDKATDFRELGGNDEADTRNKREEIQRVNNEVAGSEKMRDSLGNTAAIVPVHKKDHLREKGTIADGIVEGGGEASAVGSASAAIEDKNHSDLEQQISKAVSQNAAALSSSASADPNETKTSKKKSKTKGSIYDYDKLNKIGNKYHEMVKNALEDPEEEGTKREEAFQRNNTI